MNSPSPPPAKKQYWTLLQCNHHTNSIREHQQKTFFMLSRFCSLKAVRQTAQNDVSIEWKHASKNESKSIFQSFFSWELGKEIFSQSWREEWNKEIHHSKKISPFKTQVTATIFKFKTHREQKGVSLSVMLNLFFFFCI